ncbi:(2Fe-2S)-binding protein [Alishewanella longhuensis]
MKQAIANGASQFAKLKAQLGVGSQCGKCVCQATEILHNELVKQHQFVEFDQLAKPAA